MSHTKVRERPKKNELALQRELDALAKSQGYKAAKSFEDLLGNFWPKNESVDEFLAATRDWRSEAIV